MNKQRLLDALQAIRETDDRHFDMNQWWDKYDACGCIIGHYIHRHPEAPLKFDNYHYPAIIEPNPDNPAGPPIVRTDNDYETIGEYFGISQEAAEWLFSSRNSEASRQKMIDKLSRFIEVNSLE